MYPSISNVLIVHGVLATLSHKSDFYVKGYVLSVALFRQEGAELPLAFLKCHSKCIWGGVLPHLKQSNRSQKFLNNSEIS